MTVEKTCRLNDYRYINREGVSSMNRVYSNKTQGFTLVELLVVMLVLVALSSITLDFTKDFAFQGRYEVTKDRYDKIKRAIIGRPDVLINGQPDISGFVADMGRLPRNIQELLVQNYCAPDYRISKGNPDIPSTHGTDYKAWCIADNAAAAVKWVEQSTNADCSDSTNSTQMECEAANKVWSGWKGPYLTLQKADYKPNAFSDGWGNQASTSDFTDHNYGWKLVHQKSDSSVITIATLNTSLAAIDDAVTLSMQSIGKSDNTTKGYDADYPLSGALPSIRHNDWTIGVSSGLMVRVQAPISFSSCEITDPPDKLSCEAAGQLWFPATTRCENTTALASCTASPLIWDSVNSICFDASKDIASCTDTNDTWNLRAATCKIFDSSSCVTPFAWDSVTSICTANSKAYCETYINTPSSITSKSLTLELYRNSDSVAFTTTVGSASIIENEQIQSLLFTGIVPDKVPQGRYKIKIIESGANYPAGHQDIFIQFVPSRSLSTINW